MWVCLLSLVLLWTPALGWIEGSLRDGTLRTKNDDSGYSFTHEGFTPQKMVTGCQGIKYDNEVYTDFYIIDATGVKKYIYPGQSVKVAFPAPGLFPGFYRQNTVFFHEMCFPKQCGASTCGFIVGPVTTTGGGGMSVNEPKRYRPQASDEKLETVTTEEKAAAAALPFWLRPPCPSSSTTTTTTAAPCVPVPSPPPPCIQPCIPCSPVTTTTTTTTTTTPTPDPTCCCPPSPPTVPTCPPPTVPTCPPPVTTVPPCAVAKGSLDTAISDSKPDTKDAAYYAALPGSIRGQTGVIYYPSCERDAFRQVAIVPFCELYKSRGRDLKDIAAAVASSKSTVNTFDPSATGDKEEPSNEEIQNEQSPVEKVENLTVTKEKRVTHPE